MRSTFSISALCDAIRRGVVLLVAGVCFLSLASCGLFDLLNGPSEEAVAVPRFASLPDTFTQYVRVSLSCPTDEATIYYTLDGSAPSSRTVRYREPFFLFSTVTVKAVAVKEGMTDSSVVARTFKHEPSSTREAVDCGVASSAVAYKPGEGVAFTVDVSAS